MRWEQLFADLEAQVAAEEQAGFEAEVGDLVRAERGALTLTDRLRAHVGFDLSFVLDDGSVLAGAVLELGADWVLLRRPGGDTLLPLGAVSGVSGLSRSAVPGSGVDARLRITLVLRGLARDRSPVRLSVRGGAVLSGTVDRVGADHLDLALHDLDQPRRPGAVTGVRCVPLAALRTVVVA